MTTERLMLEPSSNAVNNILPSPVMNIYIMHDFSLRVEYVTFDAK